MNNIHQQIQHALPAYVFGDVDAETRTQIEQHVAQCATCRTVAHEYAEVTRLLPYGLTPARPAPYLRARVLHEARRRPQTRHIARWLRQWRAGRHRVTVAWAPAVVLLLVLVGWALRPAATEVAQLAGSPIAPRAVAHLVVPRAGMRAQLSVAGLPPLPPDQNYQLWFVQPDQTRVSGGVFQVTATGTASVTIPLPADYGTYQRVGVTVEPAGGSPTPTGPNVLMGNL